MIYYHITTNLRQNGHFIPRIPKHILENEDKVTKRICVSESIEGCMAAFPYTGNLLDEERSNYLKVFEIHLDEVGLGVDDVIGPEELYKSGKVDDSLVTKESWLLREFEIPEHRQYIIQVPWMESFIWTAIPYNAAKEIFLQNKSEILVGDSVEDIDTWEMYERISYFYEENLHNEYQKKGILFSTTEGGIQYGVLPSLLNEDSTLYFASAHFKQLIPYIQTHYPTADMKVYSNQIEVVFTAGTDLLALYLYDYSFYEMEELADIELAG